MHEPKLPSLADEVHAIAYRLLILPNYGNPIVVRVNKRGSIYRVSARRLNGSGGYDPGELVEAKDAELTVTDSKKLDGLLRDLNFPQLPTEDDARGHDTDEWILEGVAKGKYHVIQRRCVTDETQKRKLSAFLKLC